MSYAPSSSSEDRVGYGRNNWRDAWLAHAAGFVPRGYRLRLLSLGIRRLRRIPSPVMNRRYVGLAESGVIFGLGSYC